VSESWLIQVDVDDAEVDLVSGLLWEVGVQGIWEIDLGSGRTRLAGGGDQQTTTTLAGELGGRWRSEAYSAEHDGWLDSWRPYARPVAAGRYLVYPAWQDVELPPGSIGVPLDAGRSFGQGGHATTRLMIEAVGDVVEGGERVLDVGCGSGILSVVAALAGAGAVLGIDVEEAALMASKENAARNGVADRVQLASTPVEEVEGTFEIVVANILANVLRELAEPIGARVSPGGCLLVSGVLEHQRDRLVDCYVPLGFAVSDERHLDNWLALTLTRTRPALE
jgi:ribosomal protein L11 methyltransferase